MEQNEVIAFLIFSSILLLIFFSAAVIFIFQFRKRRLMHMRETEKLTEEHTRQLLSTQLEIQTQTMQHIGREIHDNVGQQLTLASLYTQQLAYENKAPQVNDKIQSISNIINQSLAELRQLSKSLTDDNINTGDITELLLQACERVNGLKKSTVHFSSNRKSILLSYQTKSILLRIVQEFLQNSMKHAACKNMYVTLHADDLAVALQLKDDGKGFAVEETMHHGIGIDNMKKRTALLGGSFSLKSDEDGTAVHISIPLKHVQ